MTDACAPRFYTALQIKAQTPAVITNADYELLQDWAYTLRCDISLPKQELEAAIIAALTDIPTPETPVAPVPQQHVPVRGQVENQGGVRNRGNKRTLDALYLAGCHTPMVTQIARELLKSRYRPDQSKLDQVTALIGLEIDIPTMVMATFFTNQNDIVFPAPSFQGAHNMVVQTQAANLTPQMLVLHLAEGSFLAGRRLAVHLVESTSAAGVMLLPLDRHPGEPFAGIIPGSQLILTPNEAGLNILAPSLPPQTLPFRMFESVDLTKSPEKPAWQAAFWMGESPQGGRGTSLVNTGAASSSSSRAASSSTLRPALPLWSRGEDDDQRTPSMAEKDRAEVSRPLRIMMGSNVARLERIGMTGKPDTTSMCNFVRLSLPHNDRDVLTDKAIVALLRFSPNIKWDASNKDSIHIRHCAVNNDAPKSVEDVRSNLLRLGRILDGIIVEKGEVGPFSSIFLNCQISLGDTGAGCVGSLPVDIVEEAVSFAFAEMCLVLRDPSVDLLDRSALIQALSKKMTLNVSELQNQTNALFLHRMTGLEARLSSGSTRPKSSQSSSSRQSNSSRGRPSSPVHRSSSNSSRGRPSSPVNRPSGRSSSSSSSSSSGPPTGNKALCTQALAYHYKVNSSNCTKGANCRFSHDVGAASKDERRRSATKGMHNAAARDKLLALIG